MKTKIELGQAREFGDIISDTFIFFRQNFTPLLKVYFAMCGAFLVTGILASVAFAAGSSSQSFSDVYSFSGLLRFLFLVANGTSLTVASLSYMAIYKEKGNEAPTIAEVWAYFRYYYFRVFFAQVILGLALGFASAFCFFPGVYLMPIFLLVCPIMVMENANLEYAVKKAFKIIKENWWLSFGSILIVGFIVFFAFLILFVPLLVAHESGAWLTGKNFDATFDLLSAVIEYLGQVLLLLPVITVTLVYYALTEQKEAGSLTNRIKMFGAGNARGDDMIADEY